MDAQFSVEWDDKYGRTYRVPATASSLEQLEEAAKNMGGYYFNVTENTKKEKEAHNGTKEATEAI